MGRQYFVKHTHNLVAGSIAQVRYAVDVNTLEQKPAAGLALNEVGRVQVSLSRAIPFDAYARNRTTGAFVVIDRVTQRHRRRGHDPAAPVGARARPLVLGDGARQRSAPPQDEPGVRRGARRPPGPAARDPAAHRPHRRGQVDAGLRARAAALRRGPRGDGARRREPAARHQPRPRLQLGRALRERAPRRRGRAAREPGGAALRLLVPRAEPRRARADARDDRRRAVPRGLPLRAARGLPRARRPSCTARAEAGEIPQLPGVSAPYDVPAAPDLVLPTHEIDVETCVDRVVQLLERKGRI